MNAAAIRELSEKYRDYTAEVLSRLIQTPGFSGREKDRCDLILRLCKEAHFDEYRVDGLGSVVARVGHGPKTLAFDAHIDTVEIGDRGQWRQYPHLGEIADGLVYGLGASDQLGGAAAMIASGRMLRELGYDGAYTIYYTFTVMEEDCDGLCWRYLIEKEGLRPDLVVSTEPTACRLFTGQRGRMEIEIQLKGRSAHGSVPELGDSAAYKAARAALAVERLAQDLQPDADGFLGRGSVTVSRIEVTGPSQCSVPDQATLYLDRRLTWGEDAAFALGQVRDYVTEALGEPPYRIWMPRYEKRGYKNTDFSQELYFPSWRTPAGHALVRGARAAYAALYGEELVPGPCRYSTNAVAFCGRHHIPSIVMGPGDVESCHRPNETTRVEDLVRSAAFYTMLPYILEADGAV